MLYNNIIIFTQYIFITTTNNHEKKSYFCIISTMHNIHNVHHGKSKTYNFIKTNWPEIFNFIIKQPWYFITYDQNDYLKITFKHFIDLAEKNFNGVTSKTLDAIICSNAVQPTSQLNKLPQYLRLYF